MRRALLVTFALLETVRAGAQTCSSTTFITAAFYAGGTASGLIGPRPGTSPETARATSY